MKFPDDHILSAITHPGASWDVLAFIGSLNVGGCEKHLATVYPRLAAVGLKVGIVTFERGGPLEKELRAGGVDVMCSMRPPRTRILGRDLSRLLGYLWPITTVLDISRLLRSGARRHSPLLFARSLHIRWAGGRACRAFKFNYESAQSK